MPQSKHKRCLFLAAGTTLTGGNCNYLHKECCVVDFFGGRNFQRLLMFNFSSITAYLTPRILACLTISYLILHARLVIHYISCHNPDTTNNSPRRNLNLCTILFSASAQHVILPLSVTRSHDYSLYSNIIQLYKRILVIRVYILTILTKYQSIKLSLIWTLFSPPSFPCYPNTSHDVRRSADKTPTNVQTTRGIQLTVLTTLTPDQNNVGNQAAAPSLALWISIITLSQYRSLNRNLVIKTILVYEKAKHSSNTIKSPQSVRNTRLRDYMITSSLRLNNG